MEQSEMNQMQELVKQAREAVIGAQMNFNPEEYQKAFKALTLAKEHVNAARAHEEDSPDLLHASEHLMHLNETLTALQSTNSF
ncbi:hypothetical protein [Metabacillus sp. SLBN-84]